MIQQLAGHLGNPSAMAAVEAVCSQPGKIHSPLLLYGQAVGGKTVLLHSIGKSLHKQFPDLKIQYLSGGSMAYTDWTQLSDAFDVLLIDDAQEIIDIQNGAALLLDLMQRMCAQQKQMIVISNHRLFDIERNRYPLLERALEVDLSPEPSEEVTNDRNVASHGTDYYANTNHHAWENTMARLRTNISDHNDHAWLSAVEAHFAPDKLTLHVPAELHRDWMVMRYQGLIEEEMAQVLGAKPPVIEWAIRRSGSN